MRSPERKREDELQKAKLRERVDNDFRYHAPTPEQIKVYANVRSGALALALHLIEVCPPTRELYMALTKLEECVMHANAAIARSGGDS